MAVGGGRSLNLLVPEPDGRGQAGGTNGHSSEEIAESTHRESLSSRRTSGRVGIVDVLYDAEPDSGVFSYLENHFVYKHYAAIMPQVVSAWCKSLGYEVFYETYYSQSDLWNLVPDDLDFLIVSCCSQDAHAAYALSRYHQKKGARTFLGGPHAHCFPQDCLRFFDVVIGHCDKETISELLRSPPVGEIVSTRPPRFFPSVEERFDEIKQAFAYRGRFSPISTIPLFASTGCPYTCNFCVDHNSKYRTVSTDMLEEDLRFINERLPGQMIAFHDANFAVRFDETLGALERVGNKNPFGMGITLSVLNREGRMERLRDLNCRYVQCGIESLNSFNDKQGVRRADGIAARRKSIQAVFEEVSETIDMTQANIIFGLDEDSGEDIVQEYLEFIRSGVAGVINLCIPTPFAATPLYDDMQKSGRLLPIPFMFYRDAYLACRIKNYDALDYYRHMVSLLRCSTSNRAIYERVASRRLGGKRRVSFVRSLYVLVMRLVDRNQFLPKCSEILQALDSPDMRNFYNGESDVLPRFLRTEFDARVNRYAGLIEPHELLFPHLPS